MSLIQCLKRIFCGAKSNPDSGKRLTGTIKFFDRKKRFGFIIAKQQEYFLHEKSTNPKDFRALQDGAKVSFVLVKGKKGLQADKIQIV